MPEYYIPYETEGTEMFRAKVRDELYLNKCKNDSDIIMEMCAVLHPKSTLSAAVVLLINSKAVILFCCEIKTIGKNETLTD